MTRFLMPALLMIIIMTFLGGTAYAQPIFTAERPTDTQEVTVPAFARLLPVWTAGYVEVVDLGQLIADGEPPPSADSSARPAIERLEAAQRLGQLVKSLLGVNGRWFASHVLGDHCAVAWGGPELKGQFALICRPKAPSVIPKFLAAAKAELIEPENTEQVKRFRLPSSNLRVAVFQDLLFLGTTGKTGDTGMFYTVVDLARGKLRHSLADRDAFLQICARIKPNYRFFCAFLTHPPGKADDLLDADPILMQISRDLSYASVTAHQHDGRFDVQFILQPTAIDPVLWPRQPLQLDPPILALIHHERVAFAYASVIEPARWYHHKPATATAVEAKYRTMLDILLPNPDLRHQFLQAIGPELIVLVKSLPPTATASAPATSQPVLADQLHLALAMMIRLKNPPVAEEGIRQITSMLTGFAALSGTVKPQGAPPLTPQRTMYHGFTIYRLPIRSLSSDHVLSSILPAISGGELAWSVVDDYLILATDHHWLGQIIDLQFDTPDASADTESTTDPTRHAHWMARMNLSEAADCLQQLTGKTVRLAHTPTGTGDPNRFQMVIGIRTKNVRTDTDVPPVLEVFDVYSGYPAWRRLEPGDVILAVDDVELTDLNPQKQLRLLVERKKPHGQMVFTVKRDGKQRRITIHLTPPVVVAPQTIRLLQYAISHIAERYDDLELYGRYSPTGQIQLNAALNNDRTPEATTQPVPR